MELQKNLMVAMDDGTLLATDVYLPDAELPVPALVNRTPYDKDAVEWSDEIRAYVETGYAVVVQDVRGRYHSEGLFEPYEHEVSDGVVTFAWVREQPWCDGTYATFGRSYHGGTQWLPSFMKPEGLRAMVPVVTFDDMFGGSAYNGGAKVLHDLRWVCASIIPDLMARARAAGEEVTFEPPEVYGCLDRIPLASDPAVGRYTPFYLRWMMHDTYDDYWKAFSPQEHYADIEVPTLNMSGWYDIFVPSTLHNYRAMRDGGGSEDARRHARLVMGPWTHTDWSGTLNGFDFGPKASGDTVGVTQMAIDWYDHWLRGTPIRWDVDKPVKVFVMGENRWRDESDWPLPGTEWVPFYLHSAGDTSSSNAPLSPEMPADEPADAFTYDPFDPAPTVGGQVILPGECAMGPRDQREVEARPDTLVYETEPLAEALTVIGPLVAHLFVSSDCVDTDFTMKVCDVAPDGTSMLLSDGILRMRYRDSLEETRLMNPGEVYEVEVDAGATANTFLPAHRVRVSVSSSNFPRFNRNSNSGGHIWSEGRETYRVAHNSVWHDAAHPSHIVLPIVRS